MDRREFIKRAGLVLGGLGVSEAISPSILKAMSIKVPEGSTFYDADHIVILMQENRSFDHCFGSLRGVRGFGDKYAFRKPNGKSIFFQSDNDGNVYAPFNLDIKNTKATWMSSLPHSWDNQQAARNGGKYDKWLPAKRSGIKSYAAMPLTMGYYNRNDLPFYYQLADAFTVFDQYFCSSLTGTTPNRLFLWSGTIREEKNGDARPHVINESVGYHHNIHWKTLPEYLQEAGISWRIYQNEISLAKGMEGEQESYLSNFTDNPIEWFSQFNVGFSPGHRAYCLKKVDKITSQLQNSSSDQEKQKLEKSLNYYQEQVEKYSPKNWNDLTDTQRELCERAFTINSGDPDFWKLGELPPVEGEKMYLPKGDVLFQFRKDVKDGKLPQVSWLVAPERFSDHPSSPWYGAWYISEVLNILTDNPEIWKKTIFIINYDENDGYFDHVVPFCPPDNPSQKPDYHGEAGVDYVNKVQKYYNSAQLSNAEEHQGPVGLGYRVPMIICSPWTLGGYVNSEVSDHTSVIQFVEHFFQKKSKKEIHVDAISHWRRSVCGNLVSAFRTTVQKEPKMSFLDQARFMEGINEAKTKPVPKNYINFRNTDQNGNAIGFPTQEKGLRPANALPYRFDVNLIESGIHMKNNSEKAVPLLLYNRKKLNEDSGFAFPYCLYGKESYLHPIDSDYEMEIFGPNGFYRNFKGKSVPQLQIELIQLPSGDVQLNFSKVSGKQEIRLENAYSKEDKRIIIVNGYSTMIPASKIGNWYDLKISHKGNEWIFAGRAENGKTTCSDPHWA